MQWPEKYFIPSERHGFLYLPIEKVACTSIKSWIIGLEFGEQEAGQETPNRFARERMELETYGEAAAQRILADRSLLRFAFVRNPWDRLVSGFVNKFVRATYPAQQYMRRRTWRRWIDWFQSLWTGGPQRETDNSSEAEFTFRKFVAELQSADPAGYEVHWRPQAFFLGNYEIDFLGKFESMASDFAELQRRLGLTGKLKQMNETRRGTVTDACLADWTLEQLRSLDRFPDYRQFYSADLAEEVAGIYAEDIRRFDYSFGGDASSVRSKAA